MWEIPVKQQIKWARFHSSNLDRNETKLDLCQQIGGCPDDHMEGVSNTMPCSKCIGKIPMDKLKAIKPDLNTNNLEEAINIWTVLIK